MKVSRESGGISVWDLVIVALVFVAAGTVYQRGFVDRFLPAEYHSLPIMAQYFPQGLPTGVTAEDVKAGRVTRGPNNQIEVVQATPTKAPSADVGLVKGEVAEQAREPEAIVSDAVVESEEEAPAPVVAAATPEVQEKPFVLKDAPRTAWPKEVVLRSGVKFPVVMNGAAAGEILSPAGTLVSLVEVRGEHVVVSMGPNANRLILAKDTDVEDRVKAAISRATGVRR